MSSKSMKLRGRLQKHWKSSASDAHLPEAPSSRVPAGATGSRVGRTVSRSEAWRSPRCPKLPQPPPRRADDEDNSDVGDLEAELHDVWNSSTHAKSSDRDAGAEAFLCEDVAAMKLQANKAMREGRPDDAVKLYTMALANLQSSSTTGDKVAEATIYNNRAASLLEVKDYAQALRDADCAAQLRKGWSKPYFRMAQAYLAQGLFLRAMQTARHGENLSKKEFGISAEYFSPLLDRIAMAAALNGSLVGFDGRVLQVRSAGELAWLGREAPHNPLLDGPTETDSTFPCVVKELREPMSQQDRTSCESMPVGMATQRVSFRHLREAVEAAEDGDRIVLLRGTHNGCGSTINIKKRILITGEGALEEATIDFRGNSPVFRITRSCVLQNLFVDMSGFCSAVMVSGTANVQSVIEHCKVVCTGDDALNVSGSAAPVVRDCLLRGDKKCGLRCWDMSSPVLITCRLEGCGQQAVKAFHKSTPTFRQCFLSNCGAEGLVAMDQTCPVLEDSIIEGNKGPGVDVSSMSKVALHTCVIEGNVGGLWGWNSSLSDVTNSKIEGGSSIALLMDEDARIECTSVKIHGGVQATDLAWQGIYHDSNEISNATTNDLPAPVPPFVFIPSQYTRGL